MSNIVSRLKRKKIEEILETGKRMDGRELEEFRPFEINKQYLEKVEGSAEVKLGKTHVVVGVKADIGHPFEDTPDQRTVTRQVKDDMETARPMDRLVCGDVGYGKTEVAVRAAFKAVQDGKQVALLAPTTILVEQHRRTFEERLADYPVRVGALSRFRTPKEQREILLSLSQGQTDIVVGTHRLLSPDVVFKSLGLLIVDEEQRFGVRHKERLKKLRSSVDVLTLTATPIPRTLYLSLTGVRDLSLIQTPPRDRMPIITHVLPWSDQILGEAVHREMDRGRGGPG